MTLSEMRDDVRSYIKRVETVEDDMIDRWINWSQRFIARMRTFQEMKEIVEVAITEDTVDYDYPTRMKELNKMTYIYNDYEYKIDYEQYTSKWLHATQLRESRPSRYTDLGTQFRIYPIPDDDYTAYAHIARFPADLSADADESTLVDKDDVLILGATMFGLILLREDKEVIQGVSGMFNTLLQSIVTAEPVKVDWHPEVIKSTKIESIGEYWTNPFIKGGK